MMRQNSIHNLSGDHFSLRVKELVKSLPPAYFAIVMSTGIISISCFLLEMNFIALLLFWLNVWFYLSLWLLSILRILFYHREFSRDMIDHQKGPGFFTVVAGEIPDKSFFHFRRNIIRIMG